MTDGLPVRGARVVLRRCAAGDLEAFLAYRGDPEVALVEGPPEPAESPAEGDPKSIAARADDAER